MASRKRLKKTIQHISSELISEIYFRCLTTKSVDSDAVEQLITNIVVASKEYCLRAGCPDGNKNPKLVKAYYQKFYSDWAMVMEKTNKDIQGI